MYSNDLFGTRLKCLRKDRGETQKDLADFLGIKQNQIGEMENGRKASTFAKLALLCEHYNISADYLLGLTDEPRPLRQDDTAGFPHRHPGDRTERAAIKAAPTGTLGGPAPPGARPLLPFIQE